MRKTRTPQLEEEDATSMGGWLFADSFLALMVIFLATISFVPAIGGTTANNSNIGAIGGKNYVKGLNLVYDNFDINQIKLDISEFEKNEGLPPGSTVAYAKVVAGFNPKVETFDDGRFKAILFATKIQKLNLQTFAGTKFDLGASNLLKPETVVLRLTLSGK